MRICLFAFHRIPMDGKEFKSQLHPFLFGETPHFVTEFISFASSPYDMRGYDENVVYDVPTQTNEVIGNTIFVDYLTHSCSRPPLCS